jgi:cell surface hyaluronidase
VSKRALVTCISISIFMGTLVAPPAATAAVSSRSSDRVLRWSDPATWGGTLPSEGSVVNIDSGSKVLLDVSPPRLDGLQIDGKLTFARRDLELKSDWIVVHGNMQVGTRQEPFKQDAVITLTGTNTSQNIMDMGTKMLGVMGGSIDMHGRKRPGWTQLGRTASKGDRTIKLKRRMPWHRGDRIVIASTDYAAGHAEQRTVSNVEGRRLTLDAPLNWQHWGRLQKFGGKVLDERAEVGLLSRNVVVRGDDASTNNGFGGHMMVMDGGRARISNIELARMGQKKRLRRYPVHFHMDGGAPDSYIKNSSIHHTYNRCVTIHGTRRLRVQDNVCYDHLGHGFFLEDGAETDNVITGNLGILTREVEDGLLPSDERPATFWITNPDNVVSGNHAAGSERHGFWYALPEHPTGPSRTTKIWPQRTPLKVFKNNVAHSNGDTGLFVDHGPDEDGDTDSATWYQPVQNPANEDSAPVVARFKGLTAFMNRNRGVWLRGEDHVVTRSRLADNQGGATFASERSYLTRSLVVGESANKGNPEPWEDTGPGGRALPAPWEPEEEIVGFEFYDGLVGVSRTHFAEFNNNSLRKSGALGYLSPNAFSIHPRNFAKKVSFGDANRVYLPQPEQGMDGDASKVFIDRTGSVTGKRGAHVVVDNRFLLDGTCKKRDAWNAWVCGRREYGTLYVNASTSSALNPLKLHREDGPTQTLSGCCSDGEVAVSTFLPGHTFTVDFSTAPDHAEFVLWNSGGKRITLRMKAPSGTKVLRWGEVLPQTGSVGALSDKSDSAWHYDGATNTLTVRIVSRDDWSEVEVVRP